MNGGVVVIGVVYLHIFIFFSKTAVPISRKFGTKHYIGRILDSKFYTNKEAHPIKRRDNFELLILFFIKKSPDQKC